MDVRAGSRVERPPRPSLARHIACVWCQSGAPAKPLFPDAAIELVWSGRGLFIRGADTRRHDVGVFPGRTFVGVRFRPGTAADVLGVHGPSLADARIGVSELWGRVEMERLESHLAACDSPTEVAFALEEIVASRVRSLPDPAVEAVVAALDSPRVKVATLARDNGLSERQLRRRCTAALGYGPKVLDCILRFQRFRALAQRRPRAGLAELAYESGYADQPHLTHECRRLAGETPAAVLARG